MGQNESKTANVNDVDTNASLGNNVTENVVSTSTDGSVIIEMEVQIPSGIENFFEQVKIRSLIEKLKSDIRNVKILHSQILSNPITNEKKRHELNERMSAVKTSFRVIQSTLKEMEKEINEKEVELGSDALPARLRIRKTQHSSLATEFGEILNNYEKAQVEYLNRCKATIKREMEIAGTSFTNEQIDNIIEEGNLSVFTQNLMVESDAAKKMLANVQTRHKDIIQLKESIKELHELFLEMGLLIAEQEEAIERIEPQVTSTSEHLGVATVQLEEAKVYQNKFTKKKIFMILIPVVLGLFLARIIYFAFFNK